MLSAFIASFALLGATASASSACGTAHVINKCNYDVHLCNVPASGGGYEQEDKTLSPGESWNQTWTELSNGNGWSIKLSKTGSFGSNVLQYEYTYHNDGIIWYDLSCVDGNPWDQDWEITAAGASCNPKQQAYRYSTDDAYGMQSCPSEADITVTLCTGVSADKGESTDNSGSSAPSYEASSSSPAAPAYEPETSSSSTQAAASPYAYASSKTAAGYGAPKQNQSPTTLQTSTTAVETVVNGYGITVTEIETAYVTAVVTAYANKNKRHEHHPHGHAHQHNA